MNLYKDYFNIDPKYYAAVTQDLIDQGKVSWKGYYPHDSFVKMLQTTYRVLSGQAAHSIWIQGAYGTGKSHAALTIKSIIDAPEADVIEYFNDFGLNSDLRDNFVSLKATSNILTIHRIGSAGINTDMDLILAVQQSVMAALRAKGIENQGDASMKDAFLQWVSKRANKSYFSALISEDERYLWTFGGMSVDDVITRLQTGTDKQVEEMMAKVMQVLKDNGQYGIFTDVTQMADWLRSIIKENNLTAILFIWDEFSEYFMNHPVGLTGFQTLAEISQNDPFYFMIVAHQSTALFQDTKTATKILDRFGGTKGPIEIKLPENMAFRLMAQAMKKNDDPVLSAQWLTYAEALNDELTGVRRYLSAAFQKQNKLGTKTLLSDEEMQSIVPLHPYAAIVLKHISALYNARSMFEFIIDGTEDDGIAFKSFINHYGPLDDQNLLTVDMLWNFFTTKGETGLDDNVRSILGNFSQLQGSRLLPDEQRVLKTILLLQAVSLRVDDELLSPNDQNLELAFSGTDWSKGKSLNLAKGLIDKGILFTKPVAGGKNEYCVANAGSGDDIKPIREGVIKDTKTQGLITQADMKSAVTIPTSVRSRFLVEQTSVGQYFTSTVSKVKGALRPERFSVIFTFAMNNAEADRIRQQITEQINQSSNSIIFVESLTLMGDDLYKQYIDSMTFSKYYMQKDKAQASHYQNQAMQALNSWKSKIAAGAFNLYLPEQRYAQRMATLTDLQDSLVAMNHRKYYYGLEQYRLNETMYTVYQLPNGAGFGIKEELGGAFLTKNKKISLETALEGAWKVPNYWTDPAKQSLPIVHVKQKVEELIEKGFSSPANRVSILSVVDELEREPFGLMPSALSAFVLGFVLKEYATSDYFWSNGSNSESMTVDKMKAAISNALSKKVNPSMKFKEEFIVAMGPEIRRFLTVSAKAFNLPSLGSVETARDHIRIRMKNLTFPIWCLKSLLPQIALESSASLVEQVIDAYTGIANTANVIKGSESELAEQIGRIVIDHPEVEADLVSLITADQCRKGMLAYIGQYRGGVLPQLAESIGDGGNYLDEVKKKFSAGDANWVWNSSTADEKISDVILEYQIVSESCRSLGKYTKISEVVNAWNLRTNQIRIPFAAVEKHVGDLAPFLSQLHYMKQSGGITEQNKQKFYDLLLTQREAFDAFYKNQFPYFDHVAESFLDDFDEDERRELFANIPAGQFTKGTTEYYQYIENEADKYRRGRIKKQLQDKWYDKTHTKSPVAWSDRYETPILCMFDDKERGYARSMFSTIMSANPTDLKAREALEWLDQADFYARLDDEQERNRCFMERIVGSHSILLKNIGTIRRDLQKSVSDPIYAWMDNSSVQNQLKKMAEKQYKLRGHDEALAIIESMDADQLRGYLIRRLDDDPAFGMQILKGE